MQTLISNFKKKRVFSILIYDIYFHSCCLWLDSHEVRGKGKLYSSPVKQVEDAAGIKALCCPGTSPSPIKSPSKGELCNFDHSGQKIFFMEQVIIGIMTLFWELPAFPRAYDISQVKHLISNRRSKSAPFFTK